MKQINDTKTPYPTGEQFLKLFRQQMDTKHLPYMSGYSLNQDIVLYRAMLIVLSYQLGVTQIKLAETKNDDVASPLALKPLIGGLNEKHRQIVQFMSNDAMVALRDNEYHNEHENRARHACYRFLEGM